MRNEKLKQLEIQIVNWATNLPSIRAAIVCGSTERKINPGDEWADLDFEVYATDFEEFITETTWLNRFGDLWTHLHLDEEDGPVFLSVYEGGEKVDFHFFKIDELQKLVETQSLHSAYFRGYRVVVDKDNLAEKLPPPLVGPPPYPKPTPDEYAFQVNAFWYGVLYVAKQIRRRNLWVVKFRDWTAKESLFTMLEWHTQAHHHWQIDTWNDGHFMAQWVDAETWQALHHTFGGFDAPASWQALLAMMDLFRRLAVETAQMLDYSYPFVLDEKVTQQIKALYQADKY